MESSSSWGPSSAKRSKKVNEIPWGFVLSAIIKGSSLYLIPTVHTGLYGISLKPTKIMVQSQIKIY